MLACINGVQLSAGEVIMRIRRAEPLPMSHADWFTRFKVDIATLNASGAQPTNWRLIVVSISSNTGAVTCAPSSEIPDLN